MIAFIGLYFGIMFILAFPAIITAHVDFNGTDEAYAIALFGLLFWPGSLLIIICYLLYQVYMVFYRLYKKYSYILGEKRD